MNDQEQDTEVLDCGSATLRDAEIARLAGIIRTLEVKNATLVEESARLGRLLMAAQTRGDRYKHDIERRLEDIRELREVLARVQTERDNFARSLVEARKQIETSG
jgi:chromosome segregation ATPase